MKYIAVVEIAVIPRAACGFCRALDTLVLAVGTAIYFLYGIRRSELGGGIVVRVSEAKPMELPQISD